MRGPSGSQEDGVYQLRIGYHLLDGKQVALQKPLAVLESRPSAGRSGKEYQVPAGLPLNTRV